MNNLEIILPFAFVMLSGTTCIILSLRNLLPIKLLYPCGFLCFFLSLFHYFLLPQKSFGLYPISGNSLLIVITITVLTCTLVVFSSYMLKLNRFSLHYIFHSKAILYIIFYFLLSTIAQEFLLRTYVYDIFNTLSINTAFLFVFFSSFFFSFGHLGYQDKLFFIAASIFGIELSLIYWFIPNLLMIALIHGIVGSFAIINGFVRIKGETKLI